MLIEFDFKQQFYTIDYIVYQVHFFSLYEALLYLNGAHKNCLTVLN